MQVPDLLAHGLSRVPDRTCVIEGERSLTFAEVDARADRLVQAFAAGGVVPGDRVALLAYSELEYVELQVAAQRAGVLLVPLNFRLAQPELEAILADCEPVLLVHAPEFAEHATALALPATWHLGAEGAGESYDAILAGFEPAGRVRYLDSATPSSIIYTSGTTGRAKGVVISNGAFWARLLTYALELAIPHDASFLFPLPMFHVGSSIAYAFAYRGCTVVQMRQFDIGGAVSLLERHRISHAVFVPTMVGRLLELLEERHADLDALRLMVYGGSAIAPDVLRRAIETIGCEFQQGYGLTEAVNASILRSYEHDPDGQPELLASAGRAAITYELRIGDADDEELPPGEVGEILVRGPGVMDGYWNSPEDTAHVLRNGWLHTGDLGYRAASGHVYITDRLKDVIVTGGENVYSREVEDAIYAHEGVLEVAVVGVPSAQWGEAVHAVVVPKAGATLDPEEIVRYCRTRLAGYKAPKSVDIVDDLPKNASGKILKRDVRERYWTGVERRVG